MLDRFVWGDVSRISPEAPVPIVRVQREEARVGGAGNVVANVQALSGDATACGLVGHDATGKALLSGLRAAGGTLTGVVTSTIVPTTAKTRVIAHGQQIVRFDHDPIGTEAATKPLGRVTNWVRDNVQRFPVVVVSDYGKGVVTQDLLRELEGLRERYGFAYVIDPKRPNFPHYRGASLVKPNVAEARDAAGMEIEDAASLDEAGRRLLERWAAEAILISRGEQGMSLIRPRARPRHFPTAAHQVYDVTGAGDTVLATCALALGAGGSLEEAATLANLAAGIVVGKVGTATASGAELLRTLRAVA